MANSTDLFKKLDQLEQSLANHNLVQKEILTLIEAAAYLGLKTGYIYKLTHSKKIPFYKPNGKRIFFQRTDLDAWLLRNRQASQEEIEQEAANYTIKNRIK